MSMSKSSQIPSFTRTVRLRLCLGAVAAVAIVAMPLFLRLLAGT